MKIVIIEDEPMTAEDLADSLLSLSEKLEIVRILNSVGEAVSYFRENEAPDLIFSDIQLGDGSCFDIFRQVRMQSPVIYCTAYDAYALEALQHNGVNYILKPFTRRSVKAAMDKFMTLSQTISQSAVNYDAITRNLQTMMEKEQRVSSILVSWKDKIIPVKISDVALFFLEFKTAQLVTFDNKKFAVQHNLEELTEICGNQFFRANRQYLINREAIAEASQYFARKLVLTLKIEGKHEIIISKTRIQEFLSWLRQ